MYLLIDECCPKCLVRQSQKAGHIAQRTVNVPALGKGASDAEIFRFARHADAVLITHNQIHFEMLAAGKSHPGVIVLPVEAPRLQARLLRRILQLIDGPPPFAIKNRFVSIETSGRIISYRV